MSYRKACLALIAFFVATFTDLARANAELLGAAGPVLAALACLLWPVEREGERLAQTRGRVEVARARW